MIDVQFCLLEKSLPPYGITLLLLFDPGEAHNLFTPILLEIPPSHLFTFMSGRRHKSSQRASMNFGQNYGASHLRGMIVACSYLTATCMVAGSRQYSCDEQTMRDGQGDTKGSVSPNFADFRDITEA